MKTLHYFGVVGITFLLVACGGSSSSNSSVDQPDPPSGNIPNICDSDPDTYFAEQVFPILQDNCMGCHVAGGQAGNTRWQVQQVAADTQQQIDALIAAEGFQYVLDKPSGNRSHGGGTRLPSGSENFEIFAQYVQFVGVENFCG